VKPFLRKQGIAIEAQGTSVVGTDGELETPLIDGKDCAYVIYDGKTSFVVLNKLIIKAQLIGKTCFLSFISCSH
jgi:hypothetical protein